MPRVCARLFLMSYTYPTPDQVPLDTDARYYQMGGWFPFTADQYPVDFRRFFSSPEDMEQIVAVLQAAGATNITTYDERDPVIGGHVIAYGMDRRRVNGIAGELLAEDGSGPLTFRENVGDLIVRHAIPNTWFRDDPVGRETLAAFMTGTAATSGGKGSLRWAPGKNLVEIPAGKPVATGVVIPIP